MLLCLFSFHSVCLHGCGAIINLCDSTRDVICVLKHLSRGRNRANESTSPEDFIFRFASADLRWATFITDFIALGCLLMNKDCESGQNWPSMWQNETSRALCYLTEWNSRDEWFEPLFVSVSFLLSIYGQNDWHIKWYWLAKQTCDIAISFRKTISAPLTL